MRRGAIAEISLSAIAHNLHTIKKIVNYCPVIAVVKADAYGHGAVRVSKCLLKEGAACLAVAFTSEAIELRDAGIQSPIIVLFDKGNIQDYFKFKLIPVIYTVDVAYLFSKEAMKRGTKISVNVKIDTGMGRLGLHGKNIIRNVIEISQLPGLELNGLLSHFSDADLADRSYAQLQLGRFNRIKNRVSKTLKRNIFSHIANSAAVLTFKNSYLDAVRPGIMLYGYSPLIKHRIRNTGAGNTELVPAMKVKTIILSIREVPKGTPISYGRTFVTKRRSKIGVIPLGYADGFDRLFSNKADMLVRGKRVPVIGRVCMDLTMVDLTDVKDVSENDEAIILGKQVDETISARELASKSNTIPYEILTSLGSRSRKKYVENH